MSADTHAYRIENRQHSAYLNNAVERNADMAANPERRYTLEEYLELDRTSEERLEFWDGEVFCMSGGSRSHDRIIINCIVKLSASLDTSKCQVFSNDMRIRVPSAPPYRYGDLSALCGEAELEEVSGVDTLFNPQLIVEVLSPSTEAYDRGDKFSHYKSIPTFREYLLVAQHRPYVTHLFKDEDGKWIHEEVKDLDSSVRLHSLGCELPMSEIYSGVTFDSPATS